MLKVMRYVHHIPGRIRLRAEALKGNSTCATSIAAWLGSVSGVEQVEVNSLTGSVLIYYRPEATDGEHLIAQCRERLPVPGRQTSVLRNGNRSDVSKDVQRAVVKMVAGYVTQVAIERSLGALVAALF
jgi:Heavy metal associated domain 2